MNAPIQESKFIRLIMKDANEEEIAEATRNWFAFLQTLDTIISDVERDSRETTAYVRFSSVQPSNS
jgi:hypothetical protein